MCYGCKTWSFFSESNEQIRIKTQGASWKATNESWWQLRALKEWVINGRYNHRIERIKHLFRLWSSIEEILKKEKEKQKSRRIIRTDHRGTKKEKENC